MIHQEMRQVNDTLQRSQSALQELKRMQKASVAPAFVASGVLVETTGPWVLVGLPFGKLNLDGAFVLESAQRLPWQRPGMGPNQEKRCAWGQAHSSFRPFIEGR